MAAVSEQEVISEGPKIIGGLVGCHIGTQVIILGQKHLYKDS